MIAVCTPAALVPFLSRKLDGLTELTTCGVGFGSGGELLSHGIPVDIVSSTTMSQFGSMDADEQPFHVTRASSECTMSTHSLVVRNWLGTTSGHTAGLDRELASD